MSSPEIAHEPQPSQVILKMLTGEWIAQAVSVAATLGIADLLSDGPKDVADLATASSAHADSLYRLLRGLASLGIFAETEEGRFALTPLAECLRSDASNSMRNVARMWGLPFFRRTWGELLHCVKTGESGMKRALGATDPFAYLTEHLDEANIFNSAMTDLSRDAGSTVAEAYDFGRFDKIVDAGGGHGMLLTSILRRYPGPRGVVFDLPQVVNGALPTIAVAGFADRCETIAGDLLESVPAGADAYVMRNIIHGFEKERALLILRNIRRAIVPYGRLLLVDFVVPSGNGPSLSKLGDLNMLVMSGGRERTAREFEELLRGAGFNLAGIHPTASLHSIIEGVPS